MMMKQILFSLLLTALYLGTVDSFFGCAWFPTFEGEQAFFPLRSVVINATVIDGITQVSIQHEFETTHPLFEATRVVTYELPIDEQGAVTAFRGFIENRIIEGVVKDKVEARNDFNEAVNNGQPAFLAESESPDVFKLSLGNVPAGDVLRVQLVYVAPIEAVSSRLLRITLPSSLAPEVEPWSIESRLPFLDNGVTINLRVATPNIISLTSPTHELTTTSTNTDGELTARLLDQEFKSRRDIVFELETRVNPILQVFAEETESSTALMMTVVPAINFVAFFNREFIFVVDRSQSMGEIRPQRVGQALRQVVAGLDPGSLFNVLGFGGRSSFLFKEGSRLVSDSSAIQAANTYFDELSNDFGWTDIPRALQRIIDTPEVESYQRNVLLITDAKLIDSSTQNFLNFVKNNRGSFRLFTLGVGEEVSRLVINGGARNGGGTADFAFEENGELNATEIRDALNRQINVATKATLEVTSIDWGNPGIQAPFITPPLFSGKRFTLFHIAEGASSPPNVRMEANFSGVQGFLDPAVYNVLSSDFIVTTGFTKATVIHQIAAREMIRDLEEQRSGLHLRPGGATDDEIRNEIIRIGVTYQIASTETSFVAIDNLGWTSVSQRQLSDGIAGQVDSAGGGLESPPPPPPPSTGGTVAFALCFPGDTMVEVKNKGLVAMKNINIGDYVATENNDFSQVYSFAHKVESESVLYLEIDAVGLLRPLVISAQHMVFVQQQNGKQKAVPSSLVVLGDSIVTGSGEAVLVTSIKSVVAKGVFAPLTMSGSLVVNGVLASSFVSLQKDADMLMVGSISSGISMQWLSHALLGPHRMFCAFNWDRCKEETYSNQGLSEFVQGPYHMARWFLQLGIIAKVLLLGPLLLVASLLAILEGSVVNFGTLGVAALATCLIFRYMIRFKHKKQAWIGGKT